MEVHNKPSKERNPHGDQVYSALLRFDKRNSRVELFLPRRIPEEVEECRREVPPRAPVDAAERLEFENGLHALAMEVCRQIYERELNGLEADDKKEMPGKVRYHKETYRINKKTPLQVASRFGASRCGRSIT